MAYRGEDIIAALRTTIGGTIAVGSDVSNINSKPEGSLPWWIGQTKTPAVIIEQKDMRAEHQIKQQHQVYGFALHYLMHEDDARASTAADKNPFTLARKRAEILAGKIDADRTLGIGTYVNDAAVAGISGQDDDFYMWLKENQQPYVAVTVLVVCSTWA